MQSNAKGHNVCPRTCLPQGGALVKYLRWLVGLGRGCTQETSCARVVGNSLQYVIRTGAVKRFM